MWFNREKPTVAHSVNFAIRQVEKVIARHVAEWTLYDRRTFLLPSTVDYIASFIKNSKHSGHCRYTVVARQQLAASSRWWLIGCSVILLLYNRLCIFNGSTESTSGWVIRIGCISSSSHMHSAMSAHASAWHKCFCFDLNRFCRSLLTLCTFHIQH